jgi:hypothetical protein
MVAVAVLTPQCAASRRAPQRDTNSYKSLRESTDNPSAIVHDVKRLIILFREPSNDKMAEPEMQLGSVG